MNIIPHLHLSDVSPAQIDGAKAILRVKHMVLTPDCGFGKTQAFLHAAAAVVKSGGKVLIVSDPEPAKGTWATEHLKWSHLNHLRVSVLADVPSKKVWSCRKVEFEEHPRLEVLEKDADIYVVNYQLLPWLLEHNKHKFTMIGADEADILKGPTSEFRKALIQIGGDHVKYRIAMTATPMAKDIQDYWGICRWVDGGKALYPDVSSFRAEYMKGVTLKNRTMWKSRGKDYDAQVRDKVKHLFFEYELPDKAVIPIKTVRIKAKLTEASREKYEHFKKNGMLSMITNTSDVGPMKPLSELQVVNKLMTLTSGFIYNEVVRRITAAELASADNLLALLDDNTKREAIEIFDDRKILFKKALAAIHKKHGADQPICICYVFKHELKQLQDMLPTGKSDKKVSDAEWNSGTVPYVFLQYTRSAKGRNLQGGGHIMLAYSQTFKFIDTYQIVRRLARQGQVAPEVFLYILHFAGTMDDLKTQRIGERFRGHKAMQKLIMRTIV